jgi:uncharacterized protein (DUF1778 family)
MRGRKTAKTNDIRQTRVTLYVNAEEERLLVEAATAESMPGSTFIRAAAVKAAKKVLSAANE